MISVYDPRLVARATFAWERTFTEEDVLAFARLSRDHGRHHLERDADGRLLAHGLLTATLPTKVGGDFAVLAREMHFHFVRPVHAGDTIRCTVELQEVIAEPARLRLRMAFSCVNQAGKEVLHGDILGFVLDTPERRGS